MASVGKKIYFSYLENWFSMKHDLKINFKNKFRLKKNNKKN